MGVQLSQAVEPLIRRKIFESEEQAIHSLVREYVLSQVRALQEEIAGFERKYAMHFEQFSAYLHERSQLLETGRFSEEEKQTIGQAVMQEEDNWLDWKASREMLESWLDLQKETIV
jgi:hypothetical protein